MKEWCLQALGIKNTHSLTLETCCRDEVVVVVVLAVVVVEAIAEVRKCVPVLPSASLEEAKRLLAPPAPFVEVLAEEK